MTPEQMARFIKGDCQDLDLKAINDRNADEQLAESMKDPAFKAKWDAGLKAFADRLDDQIAAQVYRELKR